MPHGNEWLVSEVLYVLERKISIVRKREIVH